MCDPEQTSYRKCRTSQSKEQSGFQGLGRWSVVSETGLVEWCAGWRWARWDRAHVSKRVLLCFVAPVLEPFQSQSQLQLRLQWQ